MRETGSRSSRHVSTLLHMENRNSANRLALGMAAGLVMTPPWRQAPPLPPLIKEGREHGHAYRHSERLLRPEQSDVDRARATHSPRARQQPEPAVAAQANQ